MIEAWRRLAAALDTGPNRIALTTALRSTLATVVPLVLLSSLGRDADAHLAVIGALGTAMVDVGGPYRSRLAAMGFLALAGPVLLLLGALVAGHWWLAAPLVFAVALGAGLIRAIGPSGNSLGINTTIALLIGLSIGGGVAWSGAAAYGGGALWTILVTLAFWELRPYRRLEREVASAWEAVAALVATAAAPADDGAVAAIDREQRVTRAHRAARVAVEQARDALGETRAGVAGPGTTLAQLLVLLNAAARTGAATLTLYEIESRSAADPALEAARREALAALCQSCHAVARELIAGRGEISLAALRERLDRLAAPARSEAGAAAAPLEAERLAFAQALRHLESARETLPLFFGRRHRLPDLLRLPFANRRPSGVAIAALSAHLDGGSAIFRHAVRIAGVAAVGTAIVSRWQLPHGIWLPLTAMAVLQPEYGGTRGRALERTAGTLGGAVVASLLLATLSGTVALDVAIAALLFATFLLIRRRYGAAMTFLTPLIILLIGTSSADPWVDLGERVAYTLVGALLAIAAAHLLWPQWEHERLRPLLARAIRAERAYLAAVLGALAEAAPPDPAINALRRQAEIDVGNADAAYQRMLAEPAARQRSVARRFVLMVFIHRLCRHAIALATHIGAVALPPSEVEALRGLLDAGLEEVAAALLGERAPAPRPPFDEPLARLRAALAPDADDGTRATVARLLDRIVSATTALNTGCAPDAPAAGYSEVGGEG